MGTPGQSVKVAIDTGSDELWVNPDCTSSSLTASQVKECKADGHYTASSSDTSSKLTKTNSIRYGKGQVDLAYYSDNIALPQSTINVTSVQFGVATASEDLNEGILGLGWGKGVNLGYDNFIDALAEQNVTNSRAFSVALGSVDASNGGVLIFGGVDTKKFSGPLVSNRILGPQGGEAINRYWIQMSSVGITKPGSSSSSVYSNSGMPIVLDSGSSLSYLPSSLVKSMANDLQGNFDSQSGFYLIDCKQVTQKGSIDFTFGSVSIKVPYSEFIWQYDAQNCILGAIPVATSSNGAEMTFLLGDTFMRSAFVVFDQTQKTISMAQYVNCGDNEQVIPASGAGNFTGECQGVAAKSAAGKVAFSTAAFALAGVAGFALAL